MSYLINAVAQAWRENSYEYMQRDTYTETYRFGPLSDVLKIADRYGEIFLDIDDTAMINDDPDTVDVETLEQIAHKSAFVSLCSSQDMQRKSRILAGFGEPISGIPLNKLVRFAEAENPYLIRIVNKKTEVWGYNSATRVFTDESERYLGRQDRLIFPIRHHYDKPDPLVFHVAMEFFRQKHGLEEQPEAVIVDDIRGSGIAAGNMGGIDTALVRPYPLWGDHDKRVCCVRLLDGIVGGVMTNYRGDPIPVPALSE